MPLQVTGRSAPPPDDEFIDRSYDEGGGPDYDEVGSGLDYGLTA